MTPSLRMDALVLAIVAGSKVSGPTGVQAEGRCAATPEDAWRLAREAAQIRAPEVLAKFAPIDHVGFARERNQFFAKAEKAVLRSTATPHGRRPASGHAVPQARRLLAHRRARVVVRR